MISLFLAVSRFGDAALDTISSSLTRLCFFLLQSCLSIAESPVSGTLRLILLHLHLPTSAFFYSDPVLFANISYI